MTRKFLLLFVTLIVASVIYGQEVDYVISDPGKVEKKKFEKPTVADSNVIPNPDYISYFLSATAYTLEKKKIRLSGTDILFVKGSYGLTDNTMISVNLSAFGTATASIKQQINLSEDLKLGIAASGGFLFSSYDTTSASFDTNAYFGGGQVMATLGDKQDNITIGTGFYYIKTSFDIQGNGESDLLINNVYVGFQKQLGKKLYIMAEGIYFINYQVFTGALGVKLVMGERMTLNFGIMPFAFNNPGTNQTDVMPIALPLISFRMLLGKR